MVSLRLENAIVLLMALFAGSSTLRAQETGQLKRKTGILPEVIQEEMVTRQAICRRVSEPPVLNGKLDDDEIIFMELPPSFKKQGHNLVT